MQSQTQSDDPCTDLFIHYIPYVVVNNAGVGNSGAVDWISMDTFRRVVEVNFFGVLRITRALLPLLKKNKHSRWGRGKGLDAYRPSVRDNVIATMTAPYIMTLIEILPHSAMPYGSMCCCCDWCRIVNLSSVAGFLSSPMMASYDASKHALEGRRLFTECIPFRVFDVVDRLYM